MQAPQSKLAIHEVLDSYERSIDSLFGEVVSSNSASVQEIVCTKLDVAIEKLVSDDKALVEALDEVHQHQRNSATLEDLQREMNELDDKLHAIMISMQTAHRGLLQSIKETASETPAKHQTVPVNVLLAYANRIAKHVPGALRADLESGNPADTGKTRLITPWPSEDLMRRGVLASGSINMLRPNEKKRRGPNNTGESSKVTSMQTADHTASVQMMNGHDPTTKPGTYDDTDGQRTLPAPAASSAAALDLDLFDPDEDD